MEIEDVIKSIDTKELKAKAKELGIKTHCVKKLDIAKQLPEDVLESLVND